LAQLLNAFTQLRGYGVGSSGILGWWEYSVYVGFSGFFLLLLGNFFYIKDQLNAGLLNQKWFWAVVIIFLLSLGNTWSIFSTLKIPLGSIERVSSRFIVIPFLVCLLIASVSINKYLSDATLKVRKLGFFVLLVFISIDLFYQFLNWSLLTTQLASGVKKVPTLQIIDSENMHYKYVVIVSWMVSIVTGFASYVYFITLKGSLSNQSAHNDKVSL
jgi:hypothetical protein